MTRGKTVSILGGLLAALLLLVVLPTVVCLGGLHWIQGRIAARLPGPPLGTSNAPPAGGSTSASEPGSTSASEPGATVPASEPGATVQVASTPPGATVILDGRVIGVTPLPAVKLTPGAHSLRWEKSGFLAQVIAVSPAAEQAGKVAATLTPIDYAHLTVDSDPADAQVLIDGEFRGRTPLTVTAIDPGEHTILVQKANFTSQQSVEVLHPGEAKSTGLVHLENKLLLMMQATLAADPRSIGAWTDLAHFYYVNNDMVRAAAYFTRARELAAEPPPTPTPDMTEGEKEALVNDAQWDRGRLQGEINKHLKQGRAYYGNALDYTKFEAEYAACDKSFQRWRDGWRSLPWIENEAFAARLNGRPERARTLFTDYTEVVDAASGAAWGGRVAGELACGDVHAAETDFPAATTALKNAPWVGDEKKFKELAWLDLAKGWEIAAAAAASDGRTALLAHVQVCLDGLDAVPAPGVLTRLEGWRAHGQWLRLKGDAAGRVTYLAARCQDAQKLLTGLPPHADDATFARVEAARLALQHAWALAAAGQTQQAQAAATALAIANPPANPLDKPVPNAPTPTGATIPTGAAEIAQQAQALAQQLATGNKPDEPSVAVIWSPKTP
ncbi:MAG: PEGA domain-containing protein [Planctomycetota bacterium]